MTVPIAATPVAPAGVAPANAADSGRNAQVQDAAKQMEGVFVSMLVKEMFKGTDLAGGQPVYSGLVTDSFSQALTDAGGLGLADVLARQLDGAA